MATRTLLFIALPVSILAGSQTVITDEFVVDIENRHLFNHQSVLIERDIAKSQAFIFSNKLLPPKNISTK